MPDRVMRSLTSGKEFPLSILNSRANLLEVLNPSSYRVRYKHFSEFWNDAASHAFVDFEDVVPP